VLLRFDLNDSCMHQAAESDCASASFVFRPAVCGLIDAHGGDRLDTRLQAVPDPDRDVLGGRIGQPRNLVEAAVVSIGLQIWL
jgi:hypothetical protein